MTRLLAAKLLIVLAMLLSMAGGPVVASEGCCGGSAAKAVAGTCCQCHMPCCAMDRKQPAPEKPAPVQPRVGQELAAAVLTAPFSVLFTFAPTEARRAPRALFADGHAPEPLAVNCIQLI